MEIIINSNRIPTLHNRLLTLIEHRMSLILNVNIYHAIDKIYFMPMQELYTIDSNNGAYIIRFNDVILEKMITPTETIEEFDFYLLEIENRLFLAR